LAVVIIFGIVGRGQAQEPVFADSRLNLRGEAAVVPDPYQWKVYVDDVTGAYQNMAGNVAMSSSTDNGSITVCSSATATWLSNSHGRVTFDETGFIWAVFGASGNADLDTSAWSYTFIPKVDESFVLGYAIGLGKSSTDILGIEGFSVVVYQGSDVIFSQDLDLETAGSLAVPLTAHQTHTVVISPVAELSVDPGLGISTMWGHFQWAIE
jgi:hypothetical protein